MKHFALTGAAGYVAVRHMKAIKETGNILSCALDPFDSVGIIDSYFPDADFFTEFERFDRHIDKLRREGKTKIDFVSICSPNFLHDAHIRFALKNNANAICEKPMVLNPWNVDALEDFEQETGRKIYNILQLRLHPAIIQLKHNVQTELKNKAQKKYEIDLSYITSRGKWYFYSWKADIQKSGGVSTNIGIHFFDMLMWVFGPLQESKLHHSDPKKASGYLELENARVRWFLSVDREDLPASLQEKGQSTFRSIKVDGKEIEFSGGFTDLHTQSYEQILEGNGFRLADVRQAIDLAYQIRNAKPTGPKEDYHPLLRK